ncbi:Voltage-dependent T-type calcium channel subunit alpha-1G [Triplophysa tibetana]|uniref:Voltage-dependent T-type calcium channel subunit alpha-1G n=1 Tax=Triplophysa tibetana TaxID=1572043 RepID=A0A5A9PWN2_9TELE|nr:Voltage-dependent T-type calcium channel subunit alpha-1G [Triplophysa tibetana]
MLVILLNCVTLGMFHPCEDSRCDSERCKILEDFDDFIFAFFAVEMVIKMVALGIFGKKCYLGDTWNRLDFFIVLAGRDIEAGLLSSQSLKQTLRECRPSIHPTKTRMLEYSLNLQNVSFSAVRTVRVLRPLRAINRVPSMRILVTLLLDTLPMLGNVLLLCFFVFFIFGIVGVQLWAGLLRNRCFLPENFSLPANRDYYHTENDDENPFICSQPRENGMRLCSSVPTLHEEGLQCQLDMASYNNTDNTTCINWNQYYTNCSAGQVNPFKGAINFDNIGYAWIAIFQVITLEGWVDIMYFVMDAHSFYNFIYFILLIIVGSFFMINLCLVVIATQFSETKQRESQLMKEQRVRFRSNASTLNSFSEPGSCYDELLKYLVHIIRKGTRQIGHLIRAAGRRAGLRVCASPQVEPPPVKRRRQKQRQGSIRHHMHHHHLHHHYHLGNGSVRADVGREVDTGSQSAAHLILPLIIPHQDPHSPSLMSLGPGTAESVHSFFHMAGPLEPLRCGPSPSLTVLQAYKRNSVPFAAPVHKNYPTLQSSLAFEQRRQRIMDPGGGSCTASVLTNLNIPPNPINTPQCLVETQGPSGKIACKDAPMNSSSTNLDTALTFDPETCPYCIKSLANDSEGLDGNETADSDSEGIYEFTQDAHYRDSRDPNRKKFAVGARATKVVHFWRLVCDTFRKIVDSKYFGRGIMIAILINTLSMGIEFHEQPDELTNALEISNIVFTSLFALEMLLKLLVYGPFGYIKNPYNIFDGIIVVISVWEIVGQQGGGLSVLRTFRLMRVLKLVRFMPALQRQLVVLMKTMDNVATFCIILGMHLFGCKFGSERDGDTLPDRKNFDTLLWAIVTILTQEDWNKVLYNGMASTSPVAALYFIALMTFGNYVLFNLLVAILVEGFQTEEVTKKEDVHGQLSCIQLPIDSGGDASKSNSEVDISSRSLEDVSGDKKDLTTCSVVPINGHVDFKTSLTPPLITHTAATPMPIPKISGGGDPVLGHESRRDSNISMDPTGQDKSPTHENVCTLQSNIKTRHALPFSLQSSARSSPNAPWSSASSWNSRRSSWNSLGRAPSLKRQKRQSGERRSLLSGDGQSSSDEGDMVESGGGGGMSEGDDASLTRTDSMSQRPGHRRMESLETRSSFDLPPETLQVPYVHHCASIHSAPPPNFLSNGKSSPSAATAQLSLDEQHSEDDNVDEEGNLSRGARLYRWLEHKQPEWCRQRATWALYLFPPQSRRFQSLDVVSDLLAVTPQIITSDLKRSPSACPYIHIREIFLLFRVTCNKIISHKLFDHVVLVIIFLNCITIAMERPRIDPSSAERIFLTLSNYIFTAIFVTEMTVKVVALGWCLGKKTYLKSSWNILDGMLVMISVIDILVSLISNSGTKILGMLRVLRLLRTLRPLRVISRAPGLKLVVETLMSSLKPIGNIVVICCAFFIIFGILGVQGEDIRNITNKSDCFQANYKWVRHKYNFDNLGQALMSLFVLASKDGWVDIMYDGLDAVGVDQQPVMNHNPWMLLYFISFLLIVAFFVLNMFVGVVVENFHKCRRHQEAEEAKLREEKRLKRMEKKRRSKEKELAEAQSKPYYSDYSPTRLLIHKICTSHYLDLFITIVIGLNVITMSMEHYQQSKVLDEALKICNYIFTIIFVLESVFKLVAFGFRRFFKDRWNQLDLAIVLLSIMGITLEEIEVNASLPINPTIIRIMRVLRIARVLKLLKMAVGMRALLDTVIQALPQVVFLGLFCQFPLCFMTNSLDFLPPSLPLLPLQVGNLGLLFMLLFFIFAALGVELFGDLICDELHPCEGLGRYATFRNFGMAFLLLFRVSTGDNWNGIMKSLVTCSPQPAIIFVLCLSSSQDTLRDCSQDTGICYNTVVSPIYFVSFVLTAQFVLVNVVIAVLMKHLEESNKEAKEEAELEAEMELELETVGGDGGIPRGRMPPLGPGDMGGPGASPWILRDSQDLSGPVYPTDSPPADICRDSEKHIKADPDPPPNLEPPLERRPMFDSVSLVIQGSLEGELSIMDNLSGSICHFYALPPFSSKHCSEKQIPLAEVEALSLSSEKSWSLALTDDSVPDDFNPLLLTSQECNSTDPPDPPDLQEQDEPMHEHLLYVKKTSVGRTHSLPNDSYMFLPLQPNASHYTHRTSSHLAQTGSTGSVQSHTEEPTQHLIVPTDLFRPISPHSLSDSESIPRIPPPRRAHTLSRTLRRQVAVSADSQETLHSEEGDNEDPPVNFPPQLQPQPSLFLVPATPGASPKPSRSSVHTQHNPYDQYNVFTRRADSPAPAKREDMDSVDHEVSLIIKAGIAGRSDDVGVTDQGTSRHELKKYHSVDTQGQRALLLPRPLSWLDDPRRHSVEVFSSVESSPQRSSISSGFVSRADSLQQQSSPRTRKKKMSPPCISVDPPEGQELPGGFHPAPPPLPHRDTCLRRRAPSSESKDSFDLGGGAEALSQDSVPNSKLLTLPSFSFEKTSTEH